MTVIINVPLNIRSRSEPQGLHRRVDVSRYPVGKDQAPRRDLDTPPQGSRHMNAATGPNKSPTHHRGWGKLHIARCNREVSSDGSTETHLTTGNSCILRYASRNRDLPTRDKDIPVNLSIDKNLSSNRVDIAVDSTGYFHQWTVGKVISVDNLRGGNAHGLPIPRLHNLFLSRRI